MDVEENNLKIEILEEEKEKEDDDDNPSLNNLWKKCLPVEIFFIRQLLLSSRHFKIFKFLFLLLTLLMSISLLYFFYLQVTHSTNLSQILFCIFLFGYALFYLLLPPIIFLFLKNSLTTLDLIPLLQETIRNDSKTKFTFLLKATFISRFNYISIIFVSILYGLYYPSAGDIYWATIIFSILFIIPATSMCIVACYILEMYRIQQMNFLSDIQLITNHCYSIEINSSTFSPSKFNNILNNTPSIILDNHDIELQSSLSPLPLQLPSKSKNQFDKFPINLKLSFFQFLLRYHSLHFYAKQISIKYGKIFLICLFSSGLLITLSIWSLYRKENSIGASLGYVFIGLIFFLEIAYLIVQINEKSFIICRELSNCLFILQSYDLSRVIESNQSTSPSSQEISIKSFSLTKDEIHQCSIFIQCMEYTKIQIYLFGDFVLRSRTLIGIIGSIVGSLLPSLISR